MSQRRGATGGAAPAIVGAALVAFLILAPPAGGATYSVTKLGDPAPNGCQPRDCSLREAVIAANGSLGVGDTIVLPRAKTYRLTIPDAMTEALSGDLDVNNDAVAIVHRGRGRATVEQRAGDRVLDIAGGAPTTLKKLVITGGEDPKDVGDGGGIRAAASLALIRTNVVDNHSTNCGGGVHTQNSAPLVMRNSRVSRNRADGNGGGISASCFGGAGSLTMHGSTVAGNRSDLDNTGNGFGGGIYLQTSGGVPSAIKRSTFAGNSTGPGGLGLSDGAGIYTDLGRLTVTASTISGNRSGDGGGGIEVEGTEPLRISNSTIADNRAKDFGGGINLVSGNVDLNAVTVVRNLGNTDGAGSEPGGGIFYGDEILELENTLLALNRAAGARNDCAGEGALGSDGHNLVSNLSFCEGFNGPRDIRRRNPRIRKLARNGGPTKTVALKRRSPAINGALRSSAPKRDQRGERRGRKPDIGAFER